MVLKFSKKKRFEIIEIIFDIVEISGKTVTKKKPKAQQKLKKTILFSQVLSRPKNPNLQKKKKKQLEKERK